MKGTELRGPAPSHQGRRPVFEANLRTVAIVSGGRGTGGGDHGSGVHGAGAAASGHTAGARIVQENRSRSTAENIRFSYELMSGQTARVGVLSNNFHIFRRHRQETGESPGLRNRPPYPAFCCPTIWCGNL